MEYRPHRRRMTRRTLPTAIAFSSPAWLAALAFAGESGAASGDASGGITVLLGVLTLVGVIYIIVVQRTQGKAQEKALEQVSRSLRSTTQLAALPHLIKEQHDQLAVLLNDEEADMALASPEARKALIETIELKISEASAPVTMFDQSKIDYEKRVREHEQTVKAYEALKTLNAAQDTLESLYGELDQTGHGQ